LICNTHDDDDDDDDDNDDDESHTYCVLLTKIIQNIKRGTLFEIKVFRHQKNTCQKREGYKKTVFP
jgi:hypothetical protein